MLAVFLHIISNYFRCITFCTIPEINIFIVVQKIIRILQALPEISHTVAWMQTLFLYFYSNTLFPNIILSTYEQILEIAVKDYLNLSECRKRDLKGYRVGIDFPVQKIPLDPYMIGYWLGDGTSSQPEITSRDSSVVKYFANHLSQYNGYLQYAGKYRYRINGVGFVQSSISFKCAKYRYKTRIVRIFINHYSCIII